MARKRESDHTIARDEGAKTRAFSRSTLLSLYLPAVILALGTGIATPAIPVYAKSFDISFGAASLVIIIYQLGATASTVPVGYLVDRIGRRPVLLTGPLLIALSSLLTVVARSFPELLVYRFIGGWAYQMWTQSRLAIIADTGGDRQRGRQITAIFGADSIGRILGPGIGGFVAAAWDIRGPFILYALLSLLAIIPSFILIQETAPSRTGKAAGPQLEAAGATAASLLTFSLIMLYLAQVFAHLARGVLFSGTLLLYAVYAYDISPEIVGTLGTITAAVGLPILLTGGYIMDRFGRKASVVPGLSLLGAGMVVLAMTAYTRAPFATFVAVFLLVQAAQSLTGGNLQTLASDMAPPQARGRFFGIFNLIAQISHTMSPVMFALLAENLGYPFSFLFLSFTSFAGAFVIGTQIKETVGRQSARPVHA